MASGVYTLEFETICCHCYLPDCVEISGQRNICPLRIIKRLKLSADQGKQLSIVARHWQYKPELFLRMANQQAEWNRIPAGGL